MSRATIAALILLAGGAVTAPAMAEHHVASATNEPEPAQIQDASRELARQANETAVEEAAKAVEADARLDLDIRLIARNSLIIAGEV